MKVIEASKLEGDESAKAVTRSRSTDELRKEIKSLHTSYSIALVVVVVGAGIIIHKQAKGKTPLTFKTYSNLIHPF